MDDHRIIDLFWSRAEQAIEALRQVYGRRLQQIAMNILDDHQAAEETVSDTYLALWNAIPPARPDPLGAFVYRVGKNTALKHLRTRTAQKRNSQYLEMLLSSEWENSKYMKVNLSVPKFDVSQTQDLKEGLRNMGLTDIFSPDTADFSAITRDTPLVITSANQSVRVQIDEKGVTAAAYIEFPAEGAAQPPEEIIDFILDRPFLFVITNDRIPLVTSVVNEP